MSSIEKTTKEKLLEEYRKKFGLCDGSLKHCGCKRELDFISKAIDQTREETIRDEMEYWKGVFDKRPKDRDLESDNIAQNFARIEIERLESKIKSLINKQ